jgi:hypothetical protein
MVKLVESLGITSVSKSQVSVSAKELDTAVEAFRTRPLDAGPYTFVAADALVQKVREAGRVKKFGQSRRLSTESATATTSPFHQSTEPASVHYQLS